MAGNVWTCRLRPTQRAECLTISQLKHKNPDSSSLLAKSCYYRLGLNGPVLLFSHPNPDMKLQPVQTPLLQLFTATSKTEQSSPATIRYFKSNEVCQLSSVPSVGVKPDESPGDPGAGVLAPHQPAGEAHSPADSGDFTPR